MHTNQNLTSDARSFRRWAKGELAAQGVTVGVLAQRIGKSRNAVSRSINHGIFPNVIKAIHSELKGFVP